MVSGSALRILAGRAAPTDHRRVSQYRQQAFGRINSSVSGGADDQEEPDGLADPSTTLAPSAPRMAAPVASVAPASRIAERPKGKWENTLDAIEDGIQDAAAVTSVVADPSNYTLPALLAGTAADKALIVGADAVTGNLNLNAYGAAIGGGIFNSIGQSLHQRQQARFGGNDLAVQDRLGRSIRDRVDGIPMGTIDDAASDYVSAPGSAMESVHGGTDRMDVDSHRSSVAHVPDAPYAGPHRGASIGLVADTVSTRSSSASSRSSMETVPDPRGVSVGIVPETVGSRSSSASSRSGSIGVVPETVGSRSSSRSRPISVPSHDGTVHSRDPDGVPVVAIRAPSVHSVESVHSLPPRAPSVVSVPSSASSARSHGGHYLTVQEDERFHESVDRIANLIGLDHESIHRHPRTPADAHALEEEALRFADSSVGPAPVIPAGTDPDVARGLRDIHEAAIRARHQMRNDILNIQRYERLSDARRHSHRLPNVVDDLNEVGADGFDAVDHANAISFLHESGQPVTDANVQRYLRNVRGEPHPLFDALPGYDFYNDADDDTINSHDSSAPSYRFQRPRVRPRPGSASSRSGDSVRTASDVGRRAPVRRRLF